MMESVLAGFDIQQTGSLVEWLRQNLEKERQNNSMAIELRFTQHTESINLILKQANDMCTKMTSDIEIAHAELHSNADRVSALVNRANDSETQINTTAQQVQAGLTQQQAVSADLHTKAIEKNGARWDCCILA